MYKVELTPRAQHEVDKLGRVEFERIVAAIRVLVGTPRPLGVTKLRGPIYRTRVGDWRIIYAVFDKDQLVIVGKITRRSEDTYNKVDRLF